VARDSRRGCGDAIQLARRLRIQFVMTALPRDPSEDDARAYRTGRRAALGALLGVVLSGPLAGTLMNAPHPQPTWYDAELFTGSYHAVHVLPYAGGVLLALALILLVSSLRVAATTGEEATARAAVIFTAPPPSPCPTTSRKRRSCRRSRNHYERFRGGAILLSRRCVFSGS
jgi:hypothetical protein